MVNRHLRKVAFYCESQLIMYFSTFVLFIELSLFHLDSVAVLQVWREMKQKVKDIMKTLLIDLLGDGGDL